jgi:hypothetical protein
VKVATAPTNGRPSVALMGSTLTDKVFEEELPEPLLGSLSPPELLSPSNRLSRLENLGVPTAIASGLIGFRTALALPAPGTMAAATPGPAPSRWTDAARSVPVAEAPGAEVATICSAAGSGTGPGRTGPGDPLTDGTERRSSCSSHRSTRRNRGLNLRRRTWERSQWRKGNQVMRHLGNRPGTSGAMWAERRRLRRRGICAAGQGPGRPWSRSVSGNGARPAALDGPPGASGRGADGIGLARQK